MVLDVALVANDSQEQLGFGGTTGKRAFSLPFRPYIAGYLAMRWLHRLVIWSYALLVYRTVR